MQQEFQHLIKLRLFDNRINSINYYVVMNFLIINFYARDDIIHCSLA